MSELTLPDLSDALLLVASHLRLESLCNLGRISRRLAFVNSDDQLWRRLFIADFGSGDVLPQLLKDGWQQAYRERYWDEVLAPADDDARVEFEVELELQQQWEEEQHGYDDWDGGSAWGEGDSADGGSWST